MKIEVAMYGQKEDGVAAPAVPQPIYRLVQWIVQTLSVIMRTFGIAEVKLDIAPAGLVPVSSVKFQAMDKMSVPPELETIRLEIIRGMLKTAMERFGIGSIHLELTVDERTELQEYWSYLQTGIAPKPAESKRDENIIFEHLPLPVETDPDKAEDKGA